MKRLVVLAAIICPLLTTVSCRAHHGRIVKRQLPAGGIAGLLCSLLPAGRCDGANGGLPDSSRYQGQGRDSTDDKRFGFNSGASVPLIGEVPLIGDSTNLGSGVRGGIAPGGEHVNVGTTDELFGIAGRDRDINVGKTPDGGFEVGGADNANFLSNLINLGQGGRVKVDKDTYGTTLEGSRGIKGLYEEHSATRIDPANLDFGTNTRKCVLGIFCVNQGGGFG